jgi:hypothetical protein
MNEENSEVRAMTQFYRGRCAYCEEEKFICRLVGNLSIDEDFDFRHGNEGGSCSTEGSQLNPIRLQDNKNIPSYSSKSANGISNLVFENQNLNSCEKESLFELLSKYADSFTDRPGKCKVFEYEFRLTDPKPTTGYSRSIPFAMRPIIRKQIEQMLADDILEVSNSPFINPMTVVPRPGKSPRLCVDARRVNSVMIPDRERAPPLHELLQRFHGARYMTSIDLNQSFLQIPLKPESRQYTAFLFDSTVYQYKRTPYGFKNSLSAFVRALKMVLRSETSSFVVCYVDDILLYSSCFAEHLKHVEIVLRKLTEAGFTINAAKSRFCRAEVSFLGHKINQYGVSPDPERMAAILKFPPPRNQKQLRQFLGTCNFHHRFIVNYASYTAPLLPLLKKCMRWKWTVEMQTAFETLRAKFADSIHLVHPDDNLPYSIFTDASKFGISSILSQTDDTGETHVVSTASRVLTLAEQRYSTCEQELLAIVYALQKFRIYVFGHKVTIYSDNKALTFLKRCALSSGRITRWMLQLQEYDLEIIHIKGTENYLADILSRNPLGLNEKQIAQMTKPREVLVAAINLNVNPVIKNELKELAAYQEKDPRILEIRQKLANAIPPLKENYMLRDGVVFRKDNKHHQYWRPILPACLERTVIKFVHSVLGHGGTDKCVSQIEPTFYLRNLGRKVRRILSCCETCQQVKHPNRNYEIEVRSHMPTAPGELMALDLYGPLPTGRAGVKYILVCLDVFSKHVKLYPLRSATTKSCLGKLTSHYFSEVRVPTSILSDHGTQFTSPSWKRALSNLNILVKYSPIRHPQSNPAERVMRELAKYCRIYCYKAQKKWPEMISHMEKWMNKTISGSTGYSPIELMFDEKRPDLFRKLLNKAPDQLPPEESLEEKVLRAYTKLKLRAEERKKKRKTGITRWEPKLQDKILLRSQPVSNAAEGVTSKFMRPFVGPYLITNIFPPSVFEISDLNGKVRGKFNKEALKPFSEEMT